MNKLYDVIVVGAGPAGSSSTYYLAQQGLSVLLLDKFDFPRDKTCGDALNPRAVASLSNIGILESLASNGYQLNEVSLFAPQGYRLDIPLFEKGQLYNYVLMVPRLILDELLVRKAVSVGADFQSRLTVDSVLTDTHGVTVQASHGRTAVTFRGRAAIVATGASLKLPLQTGLLPKPPLMSLAARAYFENINPSLTGRAELFLHSRPRPGYDWIFPMSNHSANLGTGILGFKLGNETTLPKAQPLFEAFLRSEPIQQKLAGARQAGPIKGYPLRTDFGSASTARDRILLVGEAAGLVNPLTGDGIDFALETGKLAADALGKIFESDAFSVSSFKRYDDLLRQRYGRLFRFCNWLRYLHSHPRLLDFTLNIGRHRPELKMLLVNPVLGNQ